MNEAVTAKAETDEAQPERSEDCRAFVGQLSAKLKEAAGTLPTLEDRIDNLVAEGIHLKLENEKLRELRQIDQESIAGLTQEAITAEDERRILRANLIRANERCAMIGAMVESAKRCAPTAVPHQWLDDLLTILDVQELPKIVCPKCHGPKLHGRGVGCEWCGASMDATEGWASA
ncbi:MAG: hypothetical protein ABSA67_10145 [Candidatus Brocadiia bacterium]|jgi:regulator of replication initiation timing